MPASIVVMRGSGLPLREPNEVCAGCAVVGTVGGAMRTDSDGYPVEIHRFCARCWPEHSARLEARWSEEVRLAREAWIRGDPLAPPPPSTGMGFETATWHTTLVYIREIVRSLNRSDRPSDEDLSRIAQELAIIAPDREGEMPFEIEQFIRTFRLT